MVLAITFTMPVTFTITITIDSMKGGDGISNGI